MSRHHNHRPNRAASHATAFEPLESRQLMSGGVLDTTFGNGGTVEFLKSPNFQQTFSDIAVQSDGKVVAVASERFAGRKPSFYTIRYNANGSIDRSFNGQGFIVTDGLGTENDADANAVAIQPDGKIVVVGRARVNTAFTYAHDEFAIVRYD